MEAPTNEELLQLLLNVRKQLSQNVYETGQPGTWATQLDDKIAMTLYRAGFKQVA